MKINSNLDQFSNSLKSVEHFLCDGCTILNQPPNYDLWSTINQMTKLTSLMVGLDVSEIPTKAFNPINGDASKLNYIQLFASKNYTINSGAFQNLNQLNTIHLTGFNQILSLKNGAFKSDSKSNRMLKIDFSNLRGVRFESDAFHGVNRPVNITFSNMNVNQLPESVFKPILNDGKSLINFEIIYDKSHEKPSIPPTKTTINCLNCVNYWLVKEGKTKQIANPYCVEDKAHLLFDEQIKKQLKSKCN